MRLHSVFLVLVVCALATASLRAETVSIPLALPANPVYLDSHSELSIPFDAERSLSGIDALRLHATGSYKTARSVCWEAFDIGAGTWTHEEDAGILFSLDKDGTTFCSTNYVVAEAGSGDGDFDLQLTFECVNPQSDLSRLAGGTGVVVLSGSPCDYFASYPEQCICDIFGSLSSATLILELQAGVAVETTCWGSIKALYR